MGPVTSCAGLAWRLGAWRCVAEGLSYPVQCQTGVRQDGLAGLA